MASPAIFDRRLLRARQRRACARGPATFLLEHAAAELAERLAAVLRKFGVAVDLGTPTDALRRALAGDDISTLIAAEMSPSESHNAFPRVVAYEQALPFGLPLSITQWISIGLALAGAVILWSPSARASKVIPSPAH